MIGDGAHMIPTEEVPRVWNHVRMHLVKGLQVATDTTLGEVHDDVLDGLADLWMITSGKSIIGAFVTARVEPNDMLVYALGGDRINEWSKDVDDKVTTWAKACSTDRIRFYGRKAWRRLMPHYQVAGERQGHNLYQKAVT